MEFVSLDCRRGVEEQQVWLGWNDGPVLEGGWQGLRPPVTPVAPVLLLGGVRGGRPGGGPGLPLHGPGRHRHKAGPAALRVGRLQLQSDPSCSEQ